MTCGDNLLPLPGIGSQAHDELRTDLRDILTTCSVLTLSGKHMISETPCEMQ